MTTRYDLLSPRDHNGKTYWTKVGVAFPMKGKDGFNIILEALPLPQMRDGKMECTVMMMPAKPKPSGGRQPGDETEERDGVPF